MKLSQLLQARHGLVQRARLAHLAFAYQVLGDFAARVARARLAGRVTLRSAAPREDRYWPTLVPLDFAPSLIEEHFTDEDLLNLSDAVAYLTASEAVDLTLPIDELASRWLPHLQAALAQAGVEIDGAPPSVPSCDPS